MCLTLVRNGFFNLNAVVTTGGWVDHMPPLLTSSTFFQKSGTSCAFEQLTSFRLAVISQPAVPLDHIKLLRQKCAGVVELVDAPDSKSGSERSVGSIPTTRTILINH